MSADVVAICGSMRLWPQMIEVAALLASQGTVALLPTPWPNGDRDLLAQDRHPGRLRSIRTPGGHTRFFEAEVQSLLRGES